MLIRSAYLSPNPIIYVPISDPAVKGTAVWYGQESPRLARCCESIHDKTVIEFVATLDPRRRHSLALAEVRPSLGVIGKILENHHCSCRPLMIVTMHAWPKN